MNGYIPDLSMLDATGHVAPVPQGMPPMPAAPTPTDPLLASLKEGVMSQASAGLGGGTPADKYYQYALLAGLLGSAGAGIGQAFRPWVKPPQPLPSPQAPQMPITAPTALQALTQTRAARKGY